MGRSYSFKFLKRYSHVSGRSVDLMENPFVTHAKFPLGLVHPKKPPHILSSYILSTMLGLAGLFWGDQPKWKISRDACNYVCVSCILDWDAVHKPPPKNPKVSYVNEATCKHPCGILKKGVTNTMLLV